MSCYEENGFDRNWNIEEKKSKCLRLYGQKVRGLWSINHGVHEIYEKFLRAKQPLPGQPVLKCCRKKVQYSRRKIGRQKKTDSFIKSTVIIIIIMTNDRRSKFRSYGPVDEKDVKLIEYWNSRCDS